MREVVILDLDGVIISGQSQKALLNFLNLKYKKAVNNIIVNEIRKEL